MKKITTTFLSCLLALFPAFAVAESGDSVVAEVNGEKITATELDREAQRQFGDQLATVEKITRQKAKKELLQKMVDRRLLLAAAEKAKVSPSDKELNEFLDKAYEQAGSKEKFLEMMKQRGVSEEEFFAGSRRDFQLMQFLDKKVFTEITIKDEELKEYYDKNPEMFVQPEEVSARHILVKVEEKASEADVAKAKEKAEAILAEVKKSPDKFADIAGEKSEGPSKARGGDLGFFSAGQMVKPFSDAAFAMKPGDISDLVKTQFGFHVIKVENRRGGDSVEYDKMKERIREFLTRQHQKEKLEMYVADLRKDSSVILYID